MPKKNAFCMYMETRRRDLLRAGHKLTGGLAEMAVLLNDDWQKLAPKDKEYFAEKAKELNKQRTLEQSDRNQEEDASEPQAKVQWMPGPAEERVKFVAKGSRIPPHILKEMKANELADRLKENRPVLREIMKHDDWMEMPIVICCFTLYHDPGEEGDYLPAEIGLTALSIKEGVVANFCRIIDPGTIPKGRGTQLAEEVDILGIPLPGTYPELTDHRNLMNTVEAFLTNNAGWRDNTGNLFVYAFDADYDLLRKCFEWLYKQIGYKLPIKILSLSLWAHLASTNANREWRQKDDTTTGEDTEPEILPPYQSVDATVRSSVSSFRTVGQPLNGCFMYSVDHPLTSYGLFAFETDVQDVVREVDNYKYYEELCCMYHIKKSEGIQFCALNMSNRYAFSLLEILTMSNETEVMPGKHYPAVDYPLVERRNRYSMLEAWGITEFEQAMVESQLQTAAVDPTYPCYVGRSRQFTFKDGFVRGDRAHRGTRIPSENRTCPGRYSRVTNRAGLRGEIARYYNSNDDEEDMYAEQGEGEDDGDFDDDEESPVEPEPQRSRGRVHSGRNRGVNERRPRKSI